MQINNETLRVLDENKIYDELFTVRTYEMREGIRCQVEPYKLQIKSIKNKTVKYLKQRETELDIEVALFLNYVDAQNFIDAYQSIGKQSLDVDDDLFDELLSLSSPSADVQKSADDISDNKIKELFLTDSETETQHNISAQSTESSPETVSTKKNITNQETEEIISGIKLDTNKCTHGGKRAGAGRKVGTKVAHKQETKEKISQANKIAMLGNRNAAR